MKREINGVKGEMSVFFNMKGFKYILKYIIFDVRFGEVMVVVGFSGVGKLILLEVLVGKIWFSLLLISIFVNGYFMDR